MIKNRTDTIQSRKNTDLNICNIIYGDNGSIKTIFNYFIGDTPLNKIFVLVLFVISTFTSLSEIVSYTFTDLAMIIFKTQNFNFSPDTAFTSCQLFSFFILIVAVNRKMLRKTILPMIFLIITILMKLLAEMCLLTNNTVYWCFMLCVAFSISLLVIYDSIEKKNLKKK